VLNISPEEEPNFMTYDFRHEAMHTISEWPILAKIVVSRKSGARRLDSRMVAALYTEATDENWLQMSDAEQHFAKAAIEAHS
jgi:hypothetical protein